MTQKINTTAKQIEKFAGINQSAFKSDNELISSYNMSAIEYPYISSAKGMEQIKTTNGNINGISVYNELFYTYSPENTNDCIICYGDKTCNISSQDGTSRRFFASMSDQILIMPDKMLYTPSENTAKKIDVTQNFNIDDVIADAKQNIGGAFSAPDGVAVISSNNIQSTSLSYGNFSSFCMILKDVEPGDFLHISADVYVEDVSYDEKYNKYKEKMKEGFILQLKKTFTTNSDNNAIYMLVFDDTAIDTGGYNKVYAKSITIQKKVPDLEHICTHGNRVWGVEGNTIRCSHLGDASVWYDFTSDQYGTLPSSCYSLDVDTSGDFTAICVYNGNIFAFKENCVHKIYGSQPEDYTLYTQSLSGVQKGAHNTLVCINGVLYYKGIDGFYAYSGGVPVCISEKLSPDITAVSASTDGTNYYVSAVENGEPKFFVYYTKEKIWHQLKAQDKYLIINSGTDIYAANSNTIFKLNAKSSDNTKWCFEMEFDENTFNNKCYTRLLLKYSLKKGGYFTVSTTCDGNTPLTYTNGDYEYGDECSSIIVLPRIKCKKMCVKIKGKGDFTLKHITREYFLLNEGGR